MSGKWAANALLQGRRAHSLQPFLRCSRLVAIGNATRPARYRVPEDA